MTKEEINKFLANTKIYVAGKSEEIQKKLFSLGYKWCNGFTGVENTESPFLFIYSNMSFARGNDMVFFSNNIKREISAEEVLSLELTDDYRPFKDIEECWNEMLKHQPFGWTKLIGETGYSLITDVDNDLLYSDAFKECTFADGTPFGIKEE